MAKGIILAVCSSEECPLTISIQRMLPFRATYETLSHQSTCAQVLLICEQRTLLIKATLPTKLPWALMLYISEQRMLLVKASGRYSPTRHSPTKVLRTLMPYISEQRTLLIKATGRCSPTKVHELLQQQVYSP